MPQSKIAGLIGRYPGSKLLALACAVGVWAAVGTASRGEEIFDVSLRFTGVGEGLAVNPDQLEPVTVQLRGPRSRLQGLRTNGVIVTVDCSNVYGPTERTINIHEASLRLPPTVEFVRAVPSQLRFTLQQESSRQVEVFPQFVGQYEDGYEVARRRVDPEQLTVVGPPDRLALVEQVGVDPIDLSGVVGTRSFRVSAFLADPYLRFEGDPTVTVEVEMRRR